MRIQVVAPKPRRTGGGIRIQVIEPTAEQKEERARQQVIEEEEKAQESIRIKVIKATAQQREQTARQQEVLRRQEEQEGFQRGVRFLTKKELARRRAVEITDKELLTPEEKKAQESIRKAEEITGTKDSGAGFIITTKKPRARKTKFEEFAFGEVGEQFIGVGGLIGMPIITGREVVTEAQKLGKGVGFVAEVVVPTTPADVFIFGATTGLIQTGIAIKSLSKIRKVASVGVAQVQAEGKIITETIFKTTGRGLGRAIGVTKVLPLEKGVSISITDVAGITGKSAGVSLRTGKQVIKKVHIFKGVQATVTKDIGVKIIAKAKDVVVTKDIGKFFVQISRGKVFRVPIKKGGIVGEITSEQFIGAGIGKQGRIASMIRGKSATITGELPVESLSILIKKGAVQKISTVSAKGISSIPKTKLISTQALADTQAVISRATISKPITLPTTIVTLPTTKAITKIKTKTEQITSALVIPKQIQQLKQKAVVIPTQAIITKQTIAQPSVLKQASIVRQAPKEVSALKQVPLLRQEQALKQRQILRAISISKSLVVPTIFIPLPITSVTPPLATPPFKIRSPKLKGAKGTFIVSERRFGKFRPIGAGLSLPQAITVGAGRVGRGLGATFKLTPERKGQQVGGIRTPKGFRRKKGLVFIEARELRISTPTEVSALKRARRRKR